MKSGLTSVARRVSSARPVAICDTGTFGASLCDRRSFFRVSNRGVSSTPRDSSPSRSMCRVVFCVLVVFVSIPSTTNACSTFLVGRAASFDGSVLVTHSDDGEGNPDARLSYIPAKSHDPNSKRPVWPDLEDNPRFVGNERGETYAPGRSVPIETPKTEPIGFIDQVNYTHGYHEGNYGIINDKQLGIGESTCSGRFEAEGRHNGGDALFCANELSRIAMERCATARCAVELMGSLAYEHGFYGASGSFEGGSETLLIGDTMEGWVMHFVPYPVNNSAVWVAQRVPDDEVTVVMNMFTIREFDLEDTENYLASPNMLEVAVKHGLWDDSDTKNNPFDFTQAFSAGEYAHKYYSGRRVWGGFRLINPEWTESNLTPIYGDLRLDAPYPFSIKPLNKVRVTDLFKWHRDWYEGTPFDMSVGLAGGPFGVPDRFTNAPINPNNISKRVQGSWERSIALHRTTYTHVVQSRGWLPDPVGGVMWVGMHAAHGTCFLPTPCGVEALSYGLTLGNATKVDRTSIWWAHRFVLNLARGLRFDLAIQDIRGYQRKWEAKGEAVLKEMERLFGEGKKDLSASPTALLTKITSEHAKHVTSAWWELADSLMAKYADGFVSPDDGHTEPGQSVGYPEWWLEAVGYQDGPPPPPDPPKNGWGKVLFGGRALRKGGKGRSGGDGGGVGAAVA